MSKARNKGNAGEREVLAILQQIRPDARRQPYSGAWRPTKDDTSWVGDIIIESPPKFIVEVKRRKGGKEKLYNQLKEHDCLVQGDLRVTTLDRYIESGGFKKKVKCKPIETKHIGSDKSILGSLFSGVSDVVCLRVDRKEWLIIWKEMY